MAKDVIGIIDGASTDINIIIDSLVDLIDSEVAKINSTMASIVGSIKEGSNVEADLIALNEGLRASGFLPIVGTILNDGCEQMINKAGQLNKTLNNELFQFSEESILKMKALKSTAFNNIKDATQV